MKKKTYTVTTIINHSRALIHMALSNQWNRFLEHVGENFVYIADYDALYSKDRDSFAKQIQSMACHIPDAAAEEAKRVTQSMLFGKSTAFRQIQVKQNATASRLCFHSIDGMYYYLYPNEILYFEADDHRCIVHTTDNTFACARKLQSIVQPPFYHVSKSYLVNPLYVTRIERYKATMTDGNQLPISRPKYMEFKKLLEGKDL